MLFLYPKVQSLVTQTVKCLPTMLETQVRSLGQEDPLEKEMAIHSWLLPGKSHGQRSLVGYSPWGRKELDTTERLHFHFLSLFLYPKPDTQELTNMGNPGALFFKYRQSITLRNISHYYDEVYHYYEEEVI